MGFELELKQGLSLGVAAAATQIEGGECGHNWNDWYRQGKIKDKSDPARATDHYNLWQQDADLMADMKISHYRLGIEWARICPNENEISNDAIEHYRQEFSYLKSKGICILLTIHHFTNPMWFENKGGFLKSENLHYFLEFVELVVKSFGDLVSEYITINEPNVYATSSFYFGEFPPGEKSFSKTITVMTNMSICHIEAYKLIHKMREDMGYHDTKISFANHVRVFDPENKKNPWHCICAKLSERFFQTVVSQAMYTGKFNYPFKKQKLIEPGEYCDFIALNYYSRSTVKGLGDGAKKDAPKNDLGWEIYPEGIVRCAQKLYDILKRPIYVTENGTCDNQDSFRSRYIYDHLKEISESSLPFERYYHWCFCDNFEWIDGESSRFGIVHTNYETQERTIKKSGEFYTKIIEQGKITQELYDQYVKPQEYHF